MMMPTPDGKEGRRTGWLRFEMSGILLEYLHSDVNPGSLEP